MKPAKRRQEQRRQRRQVAINHLALHGWVAIDPQSTRWASKPGSSVRVVAAVANRAQGRLVTAIVSDATRSSSAIHVASNCDTADWKEVGWERCTGNRFWRMLREMKAWGWVQ